MSKYKVKKFFETVGIVVITDLTTRVVLYAIFKLIDKIQSKKKKKRCCGCCHDDEDSFDPFVVPHDCDPYFDGCDKGC